MEPLHIIVNLNTHDNILVLLSLRKKTFLLTFLKVFHSISKYNTLEINIAILLYENYTYANKNTIQDKTIYI